MRLELRRTGSPQKQVSVRSLFSRVKEHILLACFEEYDVRLPLRMGKLLRSGCPASHYLLLQHNDIHFREGGGQR